MNAANNSIKEVYEIIKQKLIEQKYMNSFDECLSFCSKWKLMFGNTSVTCT